MRYIILSVGRFVKKSPLERLFESYIQRLRPPLELKEIEARSSLPPSLLVEAEGALFLKAIPPEAYLIALDEKGKNLKSLQFATLLKDAQSLVKPPLYFAIGGAYGLAPSVKARANILLSLGAMTWPHLLTRVLLAEQLYRAQTILGGHPYHKS